MQTRNTESSLSLLMRIAIFTIFYIVGYSLHPPAAHAARDQADPAPDPSKYLEDFEFICKTVAENYPCLETKKIDWEGITARFRPLFAACKSDVEHAKYVMRLLATLRDGHTCVYEYGVDRHLLPSKYNGLKGGGLWVAWEDGLVFLQGMVEEHPFEGRVPLGSVIAGIDHAPTWMVLEREKRRITTWRGSSSDHSLFASIGNCFFPFKDRQEIDLLFLTPGLEFIEATLPRTVADGKFFSFTQATLPQGVQRAKGAVSTLLDGEECGKLGYLRITGSMDLMTAAVFQVALEKIKGMEALLLDCRAMGGGADRWAWNMAGRFFPGGVENGTEGRIKASGLWQFDGPMVLLQDEIQVSSAESFTWALSETGRAITVGRNTGGWAIVPEGFDCPSGLIGFGLGVHNRPSPIKGIYTEGLGWPPDIHVPYGPLICGRTDPVREVGLEILKLLHAGAPREKVRHAFAALFAGHVDSFRSQAPELAKGLQGWDPERLARLVEDDLRVRLAVETALLEHEGSLPPDALGVRRRLEDLAPRAKAAGLDEPLARLEQAMEAAREECAAQEMFIRITDASLESEEGLKKNFLARFGHTRTGRYVREHLWR